MKFTFIYHFVKSYLTLYNFLVVDLTLCLEYTSSYFSLMNPTVGVTSINYIFLYLIFVSVTPVFYFSLVSSRGDFIGSLASMSFIYIFSFIFLISNNLFIFLFCYESLIIPIFLLLKGSGHYYRKTQAAFFILIWALLGSFFLFSGFFLATYYEIFFSYGRYNSNSIISEIACFLFLVGFCVKVPLWPFHYWISRAHAEGPTNLSIFLSGVLVKLSVFGIFKILNLFFFKFSFSVLYLLAIIGVVDSTLKMLLQIDSKVVVAFSTTVQMNFILFILFSVSSLSTGVLNIALVNHMLTASILFFITDLILVRFNSREFFFLSGFYSLVPLLSFFILLSLINQVNFPGFLGFLLDIFFLYGSFSNSPLVNSLLFFFLFVVEHLYIFFFFLKICFGVNNNYNFIFFRDLSGLELSLSFYLLGISILWGMFPLNFFLVFIF